MKKLFLLLLIIPIAVSCSLFDAVSSYSGEKSILDEPLYEKVGTYVESILTSDTVGEVAISIPDEDDNNTITVYDGTILAIIDLSEYSIYDTDRTLNYESILGWVGTKKYYFDITLQFYEHSSYGLSLECIVNGVEGYTYTKTFQAAREEVVE